VILVNLLRIGLSRPSAFRLRDESDRDGMNSLRERWNLFDSTVYELHARRMLLEFLTALRQFPG